MGGHIKFNDAQQNSRLTLGLRLSYSDIEWNHFISISKGLQENQKTCACQESAAFNEATKEKGKRGGREWQRVTRKAGEADVWLGGDKKKN